MATNAPRIKHTIDADGLPLGRLATRVATLLIGKRKRSYEPQIDGGDCVKVVNIKKVVFTGDKLNKRVYYHHSQYPGGLKTTSLATIKARTPGKLLIMAVSRMLPKNRTRSTRLHRLEVE